MRIFFGFFLRLFICFLAAKFLLRALGWETRGYLVGLTLIFTANAYLFVLLEYRNRPSTGRDFLGGWLPFRGRGRKGSGPETEPPS
jgi:hypothetical protein